MRFASQRFMAVRLSSSATSTTSAPSAVSNKCCPRPSNASRSMSSFLLAGTMVALIVGGFTSSAMAQTELAKVDSASRRTTRKLVIADREALQTHPLWPALELAYDSYRHIRKDVRDYSCSLVRRERVDGRLLGHEFMTAKVRHRRSRDGQVVIPFSVYLEVLAPAEVKGREVLYVEGQNDGEMLVKKGGKRFSFVTTRISPTSETAMHNNRYPVTEFGLENLVMRLIEVVKEDIAVGAETNVQFFHDARIDGRSCTGIEVVHPVFDTRLRFHAAKVFMDNELQVPVHYEAYDWPRESGGKPVLLEQYTYRNIKLNVGFTDRDFDPANPAYGVQ